jgi:TDG/mug DNA glycosylase family protein
VCVVGLTGWRAALEKKAVAGWQDRRLSGVPVYLMPNPSGLNAHSQVPDLAGHLRVAYNAPDGAPGGEAPSDENVRS